MKYKRQSRIIRIVQSMPVHTHDELIEILKKDGFNVTQATVSRDIKDLGLIKVPSPDGSAVYSVPKLSADAGAARLEMVGDTVKSVTSALHTIVINTYPGMASAVAAAVDGSLHGEILGSVAGDDTVLVICGSEDRAAELEKRIKNAFKVNGNA